MAPGPIARSTIRTTAVLVVRLIVQAATLLLLARLLGPAQYGKFASLLALAVFLGALATFGTHFVLLRALARDVSRRDSLIPAVLGTTASIGSVLLVIYLWIFTQVTGPLGSLLIPVSIGVAELLLQPLLMISSVERLAAGKVAVSQLIRLLPLPMQMAAAFAIWVLEPSEPLGLYAIAHLAAALIALALSLALLDTPWPWPHRWRVIDRRDWKDSGGFAVLAVTASGPAELDKVVAARILPLEVAGIYAAASRIAGAAVIPVSSMMISALPRLFRESGGTTAAALPGLIFVASLTYGAGIAGGIWIAAPFVGNLFGGSFAGTQEVLRWFSVAMPGLCLRLAGTNVLMAAGNPWSRAMIEGAGIVLMVALATLFASGRHATQMVIAVGSAEAVMAASAWAWIVIRNRRAATR